MKSILDSARFEIKYRIPEELINEIRKYIRIFTDRDPYMPKGNYSQYTVRSIYFDTPTLDFYHEKIDGLEIRKKVRIRTYNQENTYAFLEIKRRYASCIVKERAKVPFNMVEQIVNRDEPLFSQNGENHKAQLISGKFLYNMIKKNLCSTLLVVYEREAYVDITDANVRLTIDKNMRNRYYPHLDDFFRNDNMTTIFNSHSILELKFNDFMPTWMRNMVRDLNIRHESVSKYCLGIDSCQNTLRNEVHLCNSIY